jgi:hypothetical protein
VRPPRGDFVSTPQTARHEPPGRARRLREDRALRPSRASRRRRSPARRRRRRGPRSDSRG